VLAPTWSAITAATTSAPYPGAADDMTMDHDVPPLTWYTFFHTWHVDTGWVVACAVLGVGYLVALRRAVRRDGLPVHPVRVGCFFAGLLLLALCLCSAVDGYAMSLFWMHMVEHLTLITVVPALLVLGHPLTVLRASGDERWQQRYDRVVLRGPVSYLMHPAVGLVTYAAVIFYTHLTPFMDAMVEHPWLMGAEQVAYVVSGWMLLVGVIGEEPIRWQTPYLMRLVYLVMAMIPDTLVGIVLLQTWKAPFPMYMEMRPAWTTSVHRDLDIGGSLMWALGDGLMMLLSVGIVVSLVSGGTRDRLLGPWLESARSNAFAEHVARSGATVPTQRGATIDDDDAALEAYNEMLRRMGGSQRQPPRTP